MKNEKLVINEGKLLESFIQEDYDIPFSTAYLAFIENLLDSTLFP